MLVVVAGCAAGAVSDADPIEAGRAVYSVACASCHGGNGEGGAGPTLTGVVATFGACADHVAWVTLGSERHRTEVGPSYGDTDKPITGVMPSFGESLTPDEIARVAAYERHRFAGADAEATLVDCGVEQGAPVDGADHPAGGAERAEERRGPVT